MRGRRVVAWIAGVLAPLVIGGSCAAATLDRIRDTGTIRIGYRTDARPHSYADPSGQPAGYVVDLCRDVVASVQQALKTAPIKTEYMAVTAENRFDAVRAGRIDLLCEPSSITMSRREIVDFSLPTFVDGAGVLSKRGVPVQRFEDFKGKRVGVMAGTTTEQVLEKALADLNIQAEIHKVKDHRDGVDRTSAGDLDIYFADRAILAMLLYRQEAYRGLQLGNRYFSYETYALALPRGDDAFRLLIDRTLARLYRSGRMEDLIKKAFGSDPDELLRTLIAINAVPD